MSQYFISSMQIDLHQVEQGYKSHLTTLMTQAASADNMEVTWEANIPGLTEAGKAYMSQGNFGWSETKCAESVLSTEVTSFDFSEYSAAYGDAALYRLYKLLSQNVFWHDKITVQGNVEPIAIKNEDDISFIATALKALKLDPNEQQEFVIECGDHLPNPFSAGNLMTQIFGNKGMGPNCSVKIKFHATPTADAPVTTTDRHDTTHAAAADVETPKPPKAKAKDSFSENLKKAAAAGKNIFGGDDTKPKPTAAEATAPAPEKATTQCIGIKDPADDVMCVDHVFLNKSPNGHFSCQVPSVIDKTFGGKHKHIIHTKPAGGDALIWMAMTCCNSSQSEDASAPCGFNMVQESAIPDELIGFAYHWNCGCVTAE